MKAYLLSFIFVLLLLSLLNLGEAKNSIEDATVSANTTYLTVQQQGNNFLLSWATTSEPSDSCVVLQKSFNERQFETVAVFNSTKKKALKTYAFLDKTPFERTAHEVKIIYYRLKQVDVNQIYTYSKVVSVVRDTEKEAPL